MTDDSTTQGWLKQSTEYIAQSFKYCGITSCEIADYQSNLVKILQDAELPSNESTNEGDKYNDFFVSYVDEANVETIQLIPLVNQHYQVMLQLMMMVKF
jgi:hypothetical protein